MKKFVILALFAVFLIGCTRTQVIYPTQTQYIVEGGQAQQPKLQQNVSTQIAEVNEVDELRDKESIIQENESQKPDLYQEAGQSTNLTYEYNITKCCENGKMQVKINKYENELSIEQIRDILSKIYYDNCDKFKGNIQHSLYASFFGFLIGDARNHLINYETDDYAVLIIKGKFQSNPIKNCLRN